MNNINQIRKYINTLTAFENDLEKLNRCMIGLDLLARLLNAVKETDENAEIIRKYLKEQLDIGTEVLNDLMRSLI